MKTPSTRGFVGVIALATFLFIGAACGSRTGEVGRSSGTGGTDNCLDIGQACTATSQCCGATCDSGFCGGTCTPEGASCDGARDCCSGDCNGGVCGAACVDVGAACVAGDVCCGISECLDGACLPETCLEEGDACIDSLECCLGICDAEICNVQECLPDGDSCFDAFECCSGSCFNGSCGTAECTHGECQQGAPLGQFCSPCTDQVCNIDPFCCDSEWDDACVTMAEAQCGLPCGGCSPNGAFCGNDPDCCSGTCAGGVCGLQCLPDGAGCGGPEDCCSGQCNNGFCGFGGDCSHAECDVGGPLAPICTPCTELICDLDPFCCTQMWDGLCVDEAEQSCGLDCGGCAPDGNFCNSPLECCSQQCNGNICGQPCTPDGGFCNGPNECCTGVCNGNICGAACVPDGGFCDFPGDCCSGECNNNTCGPGADCSHDECTTGGPLLEICTPCTSQVCSADPFCCDSNWDSICVDEAEQFCGLNCNCTPDGGFCNDGGECCSGGCNGNTCGPACQDDGTFCVDPDQCCSGSCNNFQCGGCLQDGFPCGDPSECCGGQCNAGFCGAGPVCPSDGSMCGDCVAQSCCGELLGCLSSPSCFNNLLCFQNCVSDGTSLPICFFQCVDDPAAFDAIGCMANSCAGACF